MKTHGIIHYMIHTVSITYHQLDQDNNERELRLHGDILVSRQV